MLTKPNKFNKSNKFNITHFLAPYRIKKFMVSFFRYVIIIGICFVILYPLILKFSVVLMEERDLYDSTVTFIPKHITFENLKMVWDRMGYSKAFINTFILSIIVGLLQIISCTIVGYGFARFKFPFKNLIFGCVILTLIVPPQTIIVPLYLNYRFFDIFNIFKATMGQSINLIDTYWPFILSSMFAVGLKNGLYIYMVRQFFRNMPKELEEAAYVDGLGPFKTFYKVMLPSAIPTIVTVFLFSFVWQWTDNYLTSFFLKDTKILANSLAGLIPNVNRFLFTGDQTIPPAYASQLNNIGILYIIVPLIVLYIFAQKYFVESMDRSGLGGQ